MLKVGFLVTRVFFYLHSSPGTLREIWITVMALIAGIIVLGAFTTIVTIVLILKHKRYQFMKKNKERIEFKTF